MQAWFLLALARSQGLDINLVFVAFELLLFCSLPQGKPSLCFSDVIAFEHHHGLGD